MRRNRDAGSAALIGIGICQDRRKALHCRHFCNHRTMRAIQLVDIGESRRRAKTPSRGL
jgi:hypothetical protein